MPVYSIDGNIGSGKSTLVNLLKKTCKDIVFIDEPVNIWSKAGLLDKFYKNQYRWSYTFQNYAYITRLKALHEAIEKHGKDAIYITERSIETDRYVFAEILYNEQYMTDMEWDIYKSWFGFLKIPIDGVIYINTNVDDCVDRIQQRNRKEESNIDKIYLEKLDYQHKLWLQDKKNVLTIQGKEDFKNNTTVFNSIFTKIHNFIKQKNE